VRIRKQFADGAQIRILTHMVDGQRQPSGGAYYDIPLKKYLEKGPATTSLSVVAGSDKNEANLRIFRDNSA